MTSEPQNSRLEDYLGTLLDQATGPSGKVPTDVVYTDIAFPKPTDR
jgi:hypothetical protein